MRSRPQEPGPQTTPGTAKRLPPVKPADGPTRTQYLALGCGIASGVMILILAIIGATWMLVRDPPSPTSRKASPAAEPAAQAPQISGTADHINLSLHAGDPTVQWIRLTNASGERLLTARPDAKAAIPAAEYTLSVKVVARAVLKSPIVLDQDTTLTCKPTTMGRVRCVDAAGKTRQLLRP